jgi:IS30 family transposase
LAIPGIKRIRQASHSTFQDYQRVIPPRWASQNTFENKLTVMAFGVLAEVSTGYRPKQAQELSIGRQAKDNAATIHAELWSPEQISGYLLANKQPGVSHESIYQLIYADKRLGCTLHKALRCQKVRKKRTGVRERRGTIPNQVSIEQRPAIADQLKRFGDWEGDLVIGANHQQALVTLNERKSRFTLIGKVERKTAGSVAETIISLLMPFSGFVHTLTTDNGKKFAQHERIAESLNSDHFFAHPTALGSAVLMKI